MLEHITYFLASSVNKIEVDYDFIRMTQFIFLEPSDLWDIFYFNAIKELMIPIMKIRYLKNKQDFHAWVCTCKDAYINGHRQIANDL